MNITDYQKLDTTKKYIKSNKLFYPFITLGHKILAEMKTVLGKQNITNEFLINRFQNFLELIEAYYDFRLKNKHRKTLGIYLRPILEQYIQIQYFNSLDNAEQTKLVFKDMLLFQVKYGLNFDDKYFNEIINDNKKEFQFWAKDEQPFHNIEEYRKNFPNHKSIKPYLSMDKMVESINKKLNSIIKKQNVIFYYRLYCGITHNNSFTKNVWHEKTRYYQSLILISVHCLSLYKVIDELYLGNKFKDEIKKINKRGSDILAKI